MNSDEAPAKRVRRTMENDTPNFADGHEHPMKMGDFDIEVDEDVLPMASRPVAPNVDAFMLDPYKYRPQDEYLAGALIIEVSLLLTFYSCVNAPFCPFLHPYELTLNTLSPCLSPKIKQTLVRRTKRF